jgi:hypothetical protein
MTGPPGGKNLWRRSSEDRAANFREAPAKFAGGVSASGQACAAAPAPSEKVWEAWIIDAFQKAGCVVYKLSQPRATMQTEGVPDLYIAWPRRRAAWWFEVKRPGAQLRPAQQRFRERVLACGERHNFGALPEAIEVLRAIAAEPDPEELAL